MNLASRKSQIISKFSAFPWLPEFLAGFAAIVYFIQSLTFAFTQWSVIDEGNYAYKGWLFITGQYIPYQDYGPWTNHMPLSFLIFGAVQFLFGPGLRTIRYFMVFTGCLLLLGLWLTTRRLAGRWAAAVCLWFVALNPFPISDYSVGIAEGPVACILAWTLYFTLGENRSQKELFVGGLLAALLILTRENMMIVLPFLFLYILWQHGKKAGFLFLGATAATLLIVHAYYWPGIIRVWAGWIPKNLRGLLGDWVYQGAGKLDHSIAMPLLKNLLIIFNSLQANFLTLFPAIAVWLSWPKAGFKNAPQFKLVVSLSVMLVVLLFGHAWASLTKDYCTFCLVNYITFFSPVALLLFFAFLPGIKDRQPILPIWLVALIILLLSVGIGYGSYDRLGVALANLPFPRSFNIPIETSEIWRILYNKFDIDLQTQRKLLPPIAGFLVGLLIIGVSYIITKINRNNRLLSNAIYSVLFVSILGGAALSPTMILGGVAKSCGNDVLLNYEQVGAQLNQRIPPGTQIYWRGDPSPISLLYLRNIKIYPPQLNGGFSARAEKDPDKVLRYGFWNGQVDQKWRTEADIILIRDSEFPIMQKYLESKRFKELERTSPVFSCAPSTSIRIFERK